MVYIDNTIAGIVIFINITRVSPYQGVYGAVGLLLTSIVSLLLSDNSLMNCDGLYHFSPFLTGLALPLFLKSNTNGNPTLWLPEVLFPVVFGCLLTYFISLACERLLKPFKVPVLTLPFVTATQIILISAYYTRLYSINFPGPQFIYASNETTLYFNRTQFADIDAEFIFYSIFQGISQIYLIQDIYCGIFIFVAMLLANPYVGLSALFGSIIGMGFGFSFNNDGTPIYSGLFGYNTALIFPAVYCVFMNPHYRTWLFAFAATCAGPFIQMSIQKINALLGIPVFTLPFVTTTQAFLLARYGLKWLDKPSIVFLNRLKELEEESSAIFPFEVKNRNVLKMFAYAIEKKDKFLIKRLIKLIHNFDDEIDTLMLTQFVLDINADAFSVHNQPNIIKKNRNTKRTRREINF